MKTPFYLGALVGIWILAEGLGEAMSQTYEWRTFAGVTGSRGIEDTPQGIARFHHPEGVVVDQLGNLYVADRGNHVIRKVDSDGKVTTLAGRPGQGGMVDGTGAQARFAQPTGVALDAVGNLYVADNFNNRIRKVTAGGQVTTLAGTTVAGHLDGSGAGARFASPSDVVVDGAGNVYVADSSNHVIRRVTPGGEVTTFAGVPGDPGTADGTGAAARFRNPNGLALDGAGNLYVAEFNNHTIRKITLSGVVTTLAGQGGTSGSASDVNPVNARFYSPTGLAVAPDGTVYVADYYNNCIRRIAPGGAVTVLAGMPGTEGTNEGAGMAARFNNCYDVAIAPGGNLLVSDRDNHSIRYINPAGFAGTFAGVPDGLGSVDSPPNTARFEGPRGLSVDPQGNIYLADIGNHTIRRITPAGTVSTVAGLAGVLGSADGLGTAARFFLPVATTRDAAGALYVADLVNSTIREIAPDGQVSTLAGLAQTAGILDGTGAAARFNGPCGVAAMADGQVFVTDSNNHTVRRISPGGDVITLAGVAGSSGSLDGNGAAARFFSPYGLAVDAGGTVYVADTYNHTIRRITSEGAVSTVAGLAGQPGSADGLGTQARFNQPLTVAVDDSGVLFVTDAGNHLIRKIAMSGQVSTIGGAPGITGEAEGPGVASRFFDPNGIVVDGSGRIYVGDSTNRRVVRGTPWPTPWKAWLAFHGLLSGDGDEDGDGQVNLLEFAFGTHPRQPQFMVVANVFGFVNSVGSPAIDFPGGVGRVKFARRVDRVESNLNYTVQFCRDPLTWFDDAAAPVVLAVANGIEIVSVAFPSTLPNGQIPRFVRIKVTVP